VATDTDIPLPAWFPTIDPRLVAAATVASFVASALTTANSYRQVALLKEISQKLDRVIDLQIQTINEIRALGVQFRADLTSAFISDLEAGLRAGNASFFVLCGALAETQNGLQFPRDGVNYEKRHQDLMFRMEDDGHKLAQYGPATYQALIANTALLECMFDVGRVDVNFRRSFHRQRAAELSKFYSAIKADRDAFVAETEKYFTENTVEFETPRYLPTPDAQIREVPFAYIRGNPRDGYRFKANGVGEWRDWTDEYGFRLNHHITNYRDRATKSASIDACVLAVILIAKGNCEALSA
jgi:hypothetical protein